MQGNSFRLASLGHVCDTTLGKMLQTAPRGPEDQEVSYLRAGSLDVLPDTSGLPTMFAGIKEMKDYNIRGGDLLVAEGGDAGRAELVPDSIGQQTILQNSLHRVRLRSEGDIRFVRYALISIHCSGYLDVLCNKTTFGHLTVEKLRNLRIPWPSSYEQRHIADYLDNESNRIDKVITTKYNLIKLLMERRIAVTADACTGHLLNGNDCKPCSLAWAQEIPTDWKVVPLSRVATLGTGHTPSREHPELWKDCRIPWITTGEVAQLRSDRIEYLEQTREMVSHLGIANSSAIIHPAGTVVLSRTASPGYSAIMATDMATSQDFVTWTCGPRLRPRYLLLCLRGMRRDLLGRVAIGSTHKTIYLSDIKKIRIPLPSIDEQDRIVDIAWQHLNAIDKIASKLEKQVELLSEYRQAIVTAAVAGHLPRLG